MKNRNTKKAKEFEDHQEFKSNAIKHYPALRQLVINELGDALQNLSEKRKEKIIQRTVLIYIKAANKTVYKALDVIHCRIEKGEKGGAEDKDVDIRK